MLDISPKWAFRIYSKLWLEFMDKKFSKKDAQQVVEDDNLNQAFSRLKKDGWLKISLDEKDSRKSMYSLNNPEKIINEIIGEYK